MEDHVIILGWDGFSERVLRELIRSGIPVAVAAVDSADGLRDRYGVVPDVEIMELESFEAVGQLTEIDADRAARFFVNLGSDEEKLLRVVDLAERESWDAEIDVVLEDEQLEETFRDAGVRYAVSRGNVSSKLLATHIYEPAVADATEKLFTATRRGRIEDRQLADEESALSDAARDFGIEQYNIGPDFAPADAERISEETYRYGDVVSELRSRFGALPLAICRGASIDRLPAPSASVEVGDSLLIAVRGRTQREVAEFLDASGPDEGARERSDW